MSLLLDALKKAADDKKASQADNDTGAAPADTGQGSAAPGQPQTGESPGDTLLTLEPIELPDDTAPERVDPPAADATPDLELSLDEPRPEDEQQAEQRPEQAEPEPQSTASAQQAVPDRPASEAEPPLTVSPAVTDRGSDRTVSDEALNMLIYNSNRDIRKQRIATITSMIIISLLVLLSGGFYFYTDMQAEIASLERQHRNAMQAMQAKTSREQAPQQSEIIRNLVSDKGLEEKVQFARDTVSARAQEGAGSQQAKPAARSVPVNTASSNRQAAGKTGYADGQPLLSIQKSRSVDPIEQKLDRAWLAYDAGDYQASRSLYHEVLTAEPGSRDALLGIGAISIVEGDQPAAIGAYVRLLEIDPTDPIASAALSDLRTSDSNAEQVERYLVNMLQKNPKSSPLNFATGNFYAKRGRWHDAQKHYFTAWENDADNADYLFNLAVSMDQLNKPQQALGFYRDSLSRAGNRQVRFSREAVRKRIAALSE